MLLKAEPALSLLAQAQPQVWEIFGSTATKFGNNSWLVVAMIVTAVIERANKIMMPLLFVLFLGLGIYIFTLPGATEGYKYI